MISKVIIAHIGEYYRYPNAVKKFKLIRTTDYCYHFECGHKCTDSVFIDLIRCKTGEQLCNSQLELF